MQTHKNVRHLNELLAVRRSAHCIATRGALWRTGGQLLIGCGIAGTLLDARATGLNLQVHNQQYNC